MKGIKPFIPIEKIDRLILFIRGQKVLVDSDLAELYGVETYNLNKAVKRNLSRFPQDFMFQLTHKELGNLIFQNGISSGWGGRRTPPYAFTEQGVAMLASVLRSDRAVAVNIEIVRSFVRLRQLLSFFVSSLRSNPATAGILHLLRGRIVCFPTVTKKYDAQAKCRRQEGAADLQFRGVFDAIRHLMAPPAPMRVEEKKEKIGFRVTENHSTSPLAFFTSAVSGSPIINFATFVLMSAV